MSYISWIGGCWAVMLAMSLAGHLPAAMGAGEDEKPSKKPPRVEKSSLGKTRNVHRAGTLYLAGQPTPDDLGLLKKAGIRTVITLRTEGEIRWDEEKDLKEAGMAFCKIPFRKPETLTDAVFDRVRKMLKQHEGKPVLLHCGSANRVGAVWLPYRVLDQGVPLSQAVREAKAVGLRTPAYLERALDYIKRHQNQTAAGPSAAGQE